MILGLNKVLTIEYIFVIQNLSKLKNFAINAKIQSLLKFLVIQYWSPGTQECLKNKCDLIWISLDTYAMMLYLFWFLSFCSSPPDQSNTVSDITKRPEDERTSGGQNGHQEEGNQSSGK